ncbi:MAG: hypothetical protein OJF47_003184 [Nitrospira sp.]|jgi:hypothetical protein|nr:MAG: hypothetical protein OJF47_003184 [Nitrospira sp.]
MERAESSMKNQRVFRSLLCVWLSLVAGGGIACAGAPSSDSPEGGAFRAPSLSAAPQAPAVSDQRLDLFRQTPTLSGRLQINEQTVIPYIGAGFGGGYATERDRALGPSSAFPQQHLLGESLSKGMVPNEFQMGIRIPF